MAFGLALLSLTVLAGACASTTTRIPPGTQADKYLFDQGTTALSDRKWLTAREYFRQIVDGYPQSPFRSDAKLGLGDSYLGEGTTQALVQAASEFREYLTFYPTNPRADYAQYKLAMTFFRQMAKPERDQTQTRAAIKEFEVFLERYPNSSLQAEVREQYREARDRLSESEYRVGLFYYRSRWYPGAIDRFKALLSEDPAYSGRDAVYYYLAESLVKMNLQAEALPYYERLVGEFERSEYLEASQQRITELKASTISASNPPSRG